MQKFIQGATLDVVVKSKLIILLARKRFLPIFLLLSVSLVIFQNVKVFAQIKSQNAEYPKIVYMSPTEAPSPTLLPSPTPTTPTPTSIPASTSNVAEANAASATPTQSLNVAEFLLSEVNKYRQSQGLSTVTPDSNTCDFAKKRAGELSKNFNHDGFKNLPYPSYTKVTENIAQNGDYKKVVEGWINSSGHAQNMRDDTSFVCVENFGDFYAYEGWKP